MAEILKYATVCSGIGAPETAWHDLWGSPVFMSEIEKFPNAVLSHHYPDVPNYGDMTNYKEWPDHEQLRLICGGTPCQSFSVAGLRKGMDDPRGNLTLTFLGLLARFNPRWVVWENVPGVFSSGEGSDFGQFLTGLAELGYGCAYRVLDAQYFGVPQRRRRVFVVGYFGDWRPAAAVLFERESMRGNPPPSREKGERIAPPLVQCAKSSGGIGGSNQEIFAQKGDGLITDEDYTIYENHMQDSRIKECNDISPQINAKAGTGGGNLPLCVRTAQINANGHGIAEDVSHTLDGAKGQAVAFNGDTIRTLSARHDSSPCADRGMDIIAQHLQVRRLTPRECERLQGFPDDYTLIDWRKRASKEKIDQDILKYIMRSGCTEERALQVYYCPDGPRYKALGNSMAVPVMKWIGQRIQMWEDLH